MSELWETLTTGLIVSLLFIGVSYFFWRRYDKPTPLMIERQEEKARLREEQRTWREVEARMRAENEEAELKAAYERRKAEERARAAVPVSTEVNDAWKSLGVSPLEKEAATTFTAEGEDANAAHRASDQSSLTDEATGGDEDVLNAAELVQVRQDAGVQAGVEEPDWELIEKLHEIAEQDDVEVPDVPEAPDLDAPSTGEPAPATVGEESALNAPSIVEAASAEKAQKAASHSAAVGVASTGTSTPTESTDVPVPPAQTREDVVTWDLAEGEDLWDGTSWEEE
ncbi:MAG: hypothetical protein ACO20Y_08355 [Poseidonia sp.]